MATDATVVGTHETTCHDTLVPDPQVQKEFGVTAMSIWRWDRDPELIKLGWPPPIRIRSRKFRSRIALENFKSVMARRAIERRARTREEFAVPEMATVARKNGAGDAPKLKTAGPESLRKS